MLPCFESSVGKLPWGRLGEESRGSLQHSLPFCVCNRLAMGLDPCLWEWGGEERVCSEGSLPPGWGLPARVVCTAPSV